MENPILHQPAAGLEVCQPVFDRDPVRYLDMTEPVRRGFGQVLFASETGAVVRCGEECFTLFATDEATMEHICGLLPRKGDYLITTHGNEYLPLLKERLGGKIKLFLGGESCQLAHLDTQPLPLPDSSFTLRALAMESLPDLVANYPLEDEEYLRGRITQGQMVGAFEGESLCGFIGIHAEGTVGLLEVLPQYRRRGVATLLEIEMMNRELTLGHIPFGQVLTDNSPSLALQQSLGLTRSKGTVCWLFKESSKGD